MKICRSILIVWVTFAATHTVYAQTQPQVKIDFAAQIQPLLSRHCYACHGPDKQQSGLRLDQRETALAPADSDERAIVPGDAMASRLMKVIDGRDADYSMPPKGAKLNADQVKLIGEWIKQGAVYNQHWSFIPPTRPALPPVKNKSWPRNAIDHFILAKLEASGLSPSAEADAYTLVRRVYLDLIGIAPTPEQADAFVKEYAGERQAPGPKPQAYERLVDSLLASPQYGERWARKWLDLARYADTNGYEKDRVRSIWPYRDWVIRAINDDMPFDQFTIAQIAGDMLPAAKHATSKSELETRNSLLAATGFHRNTMINEEGGIDVEEFRYHAVADRVSTTGAVWLGLTLGCAQCHTHKYDPITHKEYFQLFAFLNNADEPEAQLLTTQILEQRAAIEAQIAAKEASLESRFPAQETGEIVWTVVSPAAAQSQAGVALDTLDDGSILARGNKAQADTYTITAAIKSTDIVAVKLEALTHESLPKNGPGRAPNGNFVLNDFAIAKSAKGKADPIRIQRATADVSQNNFDVAGAFDGNLQTGWAIDDGSGKMNQNRSAIFYFAKPVTLADDSNLIITLTQQHGAQHVLGRFRLLVGKAKQQAAGDGQTVEAKRKHHLETKLQAWIDANAPASRSWTVLAPASITAIKGGTFLTQDDGSILVTGDNPNQNIYTVEADAKLPRITAIRLEVLPDESLPNRGPGRAPLFSEGDFHLGEFRVKAAKIGSPADMFNAIKLTQATHSFAQPGRSAQQAIDGDLDTAWSIQGGQGKPHQAVFPLENALNHEVGSRLVIEMDQRYIHQMTIGRFRLSVTGDPLPVKASVLPAEVEAILSRSQTDWTDAQRGQVRQHFLKTMPLLAGAQSEIAKLRASLPRGVETMVMRERDPAHARTTHIHKRGEFLQPAQVVSPGVPEILHSLDAKPQAANQGPRTRLDFARWLVDERNPLVGRVVMNRHWQAIFGRGIVRTTEDFGLQGEHPTHPQLLDWLAVEFMQGGQPSSQHTPVRPFSLKDMHKLIVMSATYRQSSHVSPLLLERDPENLLLSRGPRFRVDAEMLRDSALSASGLLVQRIGGPSVFPPQPPGVTSLGYGGFNWATATGENRYRRGLYTFAKRTTPFAAFVTFDGPTGETCLVRRDRSNTPLQALTMMNDPVFVEASQAIAIRMLGENHVDEEARLVRLFRLILTRSPTPNELAAMKEYLGKQRDRLVAGEIKAVDIAGKTPKDVNVNEAAAWTTLARSLMNLDETVTKE